MKSILFIFIALILSLNGLSQNIGQQGDTLINYTDINGFKQGKWQKKYFNDKIKYEGFFVNDKPLGLFTRYYESGKIKARLNYYDDDNTNVEFFNKSGEKIAEGKYKEEFKDSIWKYFIKDSILVLEENYVLGEKKGLIKKYFLTGIIYDESYIYNGLRDSIWRQYYDNGQLKMECFHINGMRTGEINIYFPEGQLQVNGQYENDRKNGKWFFYNEDGSIAYEFEYINGVAKNQVELDKKEQELFKKMEEEKDQVVDPEDYLKNPEEYIMRLKRY